MQQNYRQLGLHSIIKSQQSRIHQLKQQIKTYNERQQQRYSQLVREHQYIVQEKDKVIEYLKNQLAQGQTTQVRYEDLAFESNRVIMRQKENMETQIRSYKNQFIELQNKLRMMQKEHHNSEKEYQYKLNDYEKREIQYQNKLKQLSQVNRKLVDDLNKIERSKNQIHREVEHLNHFYRNAVAQLPTRQTTLSWVAKLDAYMQKSQQVKQKNQKQIVSFVKTSLESLRNQLLTITNKGVKAETETSEQIKKAIQQISIISKQTKQVMSTVLKDNQSFWQLSKKDKQASYRQQISKLQIQLKKKDKKFQQQVVQLRIVIKNMENQRKTLLLGLQELKNLNQSRQKSYKEEICLLKQAIQQMTNNSEHRQSQFQQEMQNLGSQINSLSQRYYENIQNPSIKLNQNILFYLNKVKSQLSSLQSNKDFNIVLKQLGVSMNSYVANRASSTTLSSQINNCIQKNRQIVQQLQKISLKQCSFYQQYSSHLNSSPSRIDSVDLQIKAIQAKQRENKSAYQISLLRKHNQKLKEYCQSLQKKIKVNKVNTHFENNKILPYEKKILQLQSQNQALKQFKLRLENQIKQQFQQFKQSINRIQLGSSVPIISKPEEVTTKVDRLLQINQQLLFSLQNSLGEGDRIIKSLNILNNMLVRPVETFQQLIVQAFKLKENGPKSVQQNTFEKRNIGQTTIRSSYAEILKNYKNLILKRNDNAANTQKHVSQLIKTIRQTMPTKNKNQVIQQNERQLQRALPQTKSKTVVQSQKKMKEIQAQRIKDRQQFEISIQKFQTLLKTIDSKSNSKKSAQTFAKFETIIDKKIRSVIKQISQNKEGQTSQALYKITKQALRDMQSKLKEALLENQGIIKEIATIHKIQKIDKKEI